MASDFTSRRGLLRGAALIAGSALMPFSPGLLAAPRMTDNPFTLGGDIHTFAASDLTQQSDGPAIATEFVGGSITSFGMTEPEARVFTAYNPHIRFCEGRKRGYGRIDVTAKGSHVAFRALADAADPSSAISNLVTYVVEPGRAGVVAA